VAGSDGSRNQWFSKVVDGSLMNDPVQPEDGKHISFGIFGATDFTTSPKLEVTYRREICGVYLRGFYEIQCSGLLWQGIGFP